MESQLNGQTDPHSAYSAHPWVVQNFDTRSLSIVVIDDFDLHIIYCDFLQISMF